MDSKPVPTSPYSWKLNARFRKEQTRRGYFADPDHFIKDHSWIYHNKRWHVFYIRGKQAESCLGQKDIEVGHASTADFCDWQLHRPAPVDGAPSVIEKDGTFYLYANRTDVSVSAGAEGAGIILAVSTDLENWDLYDDNPVYVPNAKYYAWPRVKHCRDYHVMPFEDGYLMLFAEMTKDSVGCVGAIRSTDLIHWQDIGPIFLLEKPADKFTKWTEVGFGIPESPFLMEKDGKWHLWITDNSTTKTYHLWSDEPLKGWSWENSSYFHGSPTGWDWAGVYPVMNPEATSGGSAAFEILDTQFGWLVSYYYYDPTENKYVLRVQPIRWHDGHPFIFPFWPE